VTPEQRRARGFRARAALEDGALKEAFEETEREIHEQWSAAWWPRKRERLWHELKALERLRGKLANMAGQAPK